MTADGDTVRVAAVQYALRPIATFDDFARQSAGYVATAAEFAARLVVFPEYFTTQLMSIPANGGDFGTVRDLAGYGERYRALFTDLARRRAMHIVAGTHVVADGNRLYNAAHLFHPDGRVDVQRKLHLTPTEAGPWGISPGERLDPVALPWGKAATLTCYDVEFPELARQARARGASMIFAPTCTDDHHGYYRVRYSAHARAIENQVFVVVASTVGGLPNVEHMRSNVGEAAILAPCDFPFPPGGVLASGDRNQDMVVVANLDLGQLARARSGGSVRTWQDRRRDLYPLID